MNSVHHQGEQPVGRLLLKYSLPAIMVIQLVFARPLLMLCGAEGRVLEMAIPYLRITSVSQLCVITVISMGNILRVQGRPGLGLAFMGVGNVLNAGLAALAIFVLDLGIAGAALATLLTTVLNLGALLLFVQSRHSVLHIHRRHLKKNWELAKAILKLGAPVLLMQVFGMVTFLAANHGAAGLDGARGVAAVGVFNAIAILLIYGPLGVVQAMQPLLAYNRGAGKMHRVRALLLRALFVTTAMGIISAALVACFPGFIAALFGVQGTASHYFLAVHQPGKASVLLLGRQILAIPLFLVLPRLYGFQGLYVVSLLSDLPMALLASYYLAREWKKLSTEAKVACEDALPEGAS